MSELLELARKVAERAQGAEEVEAFLTHEHEFSVKAYDGEVEMLSAAEPRGAGIRVVRDHRVGFAYTTDLTESGLENALAQARDNATTAEPDEAAGVAPDAGSVEPLEGLFDERLEQASPDDKTTFAVALERATRAADARVRTVEEAAYADSVTEIVLANSNGLALSYRRTDAWCYAIAIAEDGDDTEVGFEFDAARSLAALDPEWVARASAARACRVLGAKKIPSASMPVLFDPYTCGQFLGVIGRVLTGEAVQKGRSPFAGKVGESVGSEALNLFDDGRAEGALGAAPWDDEGTPTQRTDVIANGVLQSYLYDLTSARREGRASTGNASRAGFKSPPGPAPSNMALQPTGESVDEVLRRGGRALLVQDFHGVHSGVNPISGDFSVGATGTLYEGGEPLQPVKEVTIAAPMLRILSGIVAVADDRRWLPFGGSLGGATTLIDEMTVSGL